MPLYCDKSNRRRCKPNPFANDMSCKQKHLRNECISNEFRAPTCQAFGSLMKGCFSASFGVMRLSGSRAIMRSSKSASCATFLRSPSEPANNPAKSFFTCGAAMVRRICTQQEELELV